MKPGGKVRLKANPGRIGILGNETDGPESRRHVLVNFLDGNEQFMREATLEKNREGNFRANNMLSREGYLVE